MAAKEAAAKEVEAREGAVAEAADAVAEAADVAAAAAVARTSLMWKETKKSDSAPDNFYLNPFFNRAVKNFNCGKYDEK